MPACCAAVHDAHTAFSMLGKLLSRLHGGTAAAAKEQEAALLAQMEELVQKLNEVRGNSASPKRTHYKLADPNDIWASGAAVRWMAVSVAIALACTACWAFRDMLWPERYGNQSAQTAAATESQQKKLS